MACAHRATQNVNIERTQSPAFVEELQRMLPPLMQEHYVPGVSVAVIENAKVVWRYGFGFKDAATKEPVDTQTVFEAASISKPVFAYLALKLCEKGVIGLDTPLSKYAPEPLLTGDSRVDLITARHVLSHSSGLPNFRSNRNPMRINFEPGSEYLYSGEGYFYLQSVITHLAGKVDPNECAEFEQGLKVCATDIGEFLERNILTPFGMRLSSYYSDEMIQSHMATGHDAEANPFPKGKPSRPGVARYASAGGLLTTPSDYAKFMIEVLDPKKPDAFRLKKEMIDEMLRPHVKVVNGPHTSSWGLGWQIQDNGLINHGGDNKGFHCHAIASRETKSGFIIMTNAEGGPKLIQKIFSDTALNTFLRVGQQGA